MVRFARYFAARAAAVSAVTVSALAVFSQGCSSAPGAEQVDNATQGQSSNACQPFVDGVNQFCPKDLAGWALLAHNSYKDCRDAAMSPIDIFQDWTCLSDLKGAGSCFNNFNAMVSCEQCAKTPNGNTCGGPYGNDFFECQNGAVKVEGACKSAEICDPTQGFQFGVVYPRQCGSCGNDHGQAPKASYHINEGYCMGSSGNAPGWHQCIDNGNGDGGGTWRYLPQLNANNNCHPAPPPPPPPPGCGCYAGNGSYCGSAMEQHASASHCGYGFTPDTNTLYACQNGKFSPDTVCESHGEVCQYNPTGADSCLVATSTCGCFAGAGNYCGSAAITHHPSNCTLPSDVTQNPSHLFSCGILSSSWTDLGNCVNGCIYNPSGADACAPQGGQ